ncbi:hypothetical protein N7451_012760 [Penicillium sp. IBT 35674x]|nr:hypothetical protein N7451_012760 [Penicillium sp. IBT 35674x]
MPEQIQPDRGCCEHFALIYIDKEGTLHHETSPSISASFQTILSSRVTTAFLKAVAESCEGGLSTPAQELPASRLSLQACLSLAAHAGGFQGVEGYLDVPSAPEFPIPPVSWLAPSVPRPARPETNAPHRKTPRVKEHGWGIQMTTISISDKVFLRRYYERVFQNLQQTNCRIIAKVYVRLIEPRKQVQYPYNGRKIVAGRTQQFTPEETKPPWWPPEVRHRDPDHLLKAERVALLIHILCDLRNSHGLTARKLKTADRPVRRCISPRQRLQLLDELYRVREEEENYLEGVIDGNTRILVSRAKLPDPLEVASGQGLKGIKSSPDGEEPICNLTTQALPMSMCSEPARGGVTLKMPTNSYAIVDTPSQQDLLMCPGFEPSSSSMLPQGLKRKHSHVGTGGSPTAMLIHMGYYPSIPVACQSLLPQNPADLAGLQQQGDWTNPIMQWS